MTLADVRDEIVQSISGATRIPVRYLSGNEIILTDKDSSNYNELARSLRLIRAYERLIAWRSNPFARYGLRISYGSVRARKIFYPSLFHGANRSLVRRAIQQKRAPRRTPFRNW